MPDYSVRPLNLFGDYLQGRQAAQGEQAMKSRNALAEMDLEQQQRFNALSQDPNATPEQFARAGRSDVSNAISITDRAKQESLQRLGAVARQALSLDPVSRRAFSKQAMQAYGSAFKALGVDPQKGMAEFETLPDDELERRLQQVAAFAPQEAGDTGPLSAYVDPKTGQPVYGTRQQALGQRPYDKPPSIVMGAYRPLSPEEVKAAGLPAGTSAQRDLATGKIDVLSKPDSTKTDQQALAKALQVYEEAKKGLLSGLAGSSTGPVAGRMPAITSAQQVAEGGIAAMAPVLKQIFRTAGEGTFTDRDQEQLMAMVPRRTDTPEARQAKMQNIDNIVRAKLGITGEVSATAPQAGGAVPSGQPVRVNSPQEAMALPPGTRFVTPDGREKVRP